MLGWYGVTCGKAACWCAGQTGRLQSELDVWSDTFGWVLSVFFFAMFRVVLACGENSPVRTHTCPPPRKYTPTPTHTKPLLLYYDPSPYCKTRPQPAIVIMTQVFMKSPTHCLSHPVSPHPRPGRWGRMRKRSLQKSMMRTKARAPHRRGCAG